MDGVTVTAANINSVTSKLATSGGNLTGQLSFAATRLTDQDTTPDVSGGNVFSTNNSRATAITALDNIRDGQEVTILVNDGTTTFNNASTLRSAGEMKLNGNTRWIAAQNDTITFIGVDNGTAVFASPSPDS